MEVFNFEAICELFPECDPEDKSNKMKYAEQYLDDVYINFISILIMLGRENEAIIYLDSAQQICERFKLRMIKAKLNLISASLEIKYKLFTKNNKIPNKLRDCEAYFKQSASKPGLGETYLLKALYEIS